MAYVGSMGRMELQEGALYYREWGAGEPVLLVHGWPVSSVYWEGTAPDLASTHRVLAVDLMGFGQSDRPAGANYGAAAQADRLAEFLRATAAWPVHMVGHSMGGMISSHLALRHPSLVRTLILDSAPLEGGTSLWPIAPIARLPGAGHLLALAARFHPLIRFIGRRFVHIGPVPEELIEALPQAAPQALSGGVRAILDGGGRRRLSQISCPTRVFFGDRDFVIRAVQAVIGAAWVPGARLVAFPDCGHCPSLEYPDRYTSELRQFWAEVTSAVSTPAEPSA